MNSSFCCDKPIVYLPNLFFFLVKEYFRTCWLSLNDCQAENTQMASQSLFLLSSLSSFCILGLILGSGQGGGCLVMLPVCGMALDFISKTIGLLNRWSVERRIALLFLPSCVCNFSMGSSHVLASSSWVDCSFSLWGLIQWNWERLFNPPVILDFIFAGFLGISKMVRFSSSSLFAFGWLGAHLEDLFLFPLPEGQEYHG